MVAAEKYLGALAADSRSGQMSSGCPGGNVWNAGALAADNGTAAQFSGGCVDIASTGCAATCSHGASAADQAWGGQVSRKVARTGAKGSGATEGPGACGCCDH